MTDEVLEYLDLKPGMRILDSTVGCGGHAYKILEKILPGGHLTGIDWDETAIEEARKNLVDFIGHFDLICNNFTDLECILNNSHIKKFDGCLLDLGVSSMQLENPQRGFSIKYDGPLDMRMDRANPVGATEIVNKLSERELVRILREFGEERFSKSIARRIIEKRRKKPITTTWELASIIKGKYRGKIHPATRTFQALRIAVNRELENLDQALKRIPDYLRKNARFCVIAFHSLEDRKVKFAFKKLAAEKSFKILTKKPLRATLEEIKSNPRARSAKLRVAEKL